MNELLHVMYEGCTWRRLPEKFRPWHTIYMRWNRWCKKGVMSSVFNALQDNGIIPNSTEFAGLDSTIVPVHKHGTGTKKLGNQCIGKSRGGNSTKILAVSLNEELPLCLMLSPGQRHDAPIGRELLQKARPKAKKLLMDRAYEDDETREVAARDGRQPVVPPKKNRKVKWEYDKIAYKRRNEVERMFGSIKENRRIATRYDKLACVYLNFVFLAFLKNALRRLA